MIDYLSDTIIAAICSQHFPDDDAATYIFHFSPLSERLREKVVKSDVKQLLLKRVMDEEGPAAQLACSLLRNHSGGVDVREALWIRWCDSKTTDSFRVHLIWRILENPNLTGEMEDELLGWIFEHWGIFQQVHSEWSNSRKGLVADLNTALETDEVIWTQNRMADQRQPDRKKWIYLCSLVAVAGKSGEVQGVLDEAMKQEGKINEVAVKLDRLLTQASACRDIP
jgi:hypothetical protein